MRMGYYDGDRAGDHAALAQGVRCLKKSALLSTSNCITAGRLPDPVSRCAGVIPDAAVQAVLGVCPLTFRWRAIRGSVQNTSSGVLHADSTPKLRAQEEYLVQTLNG
jgi:hypothetical protein